MTLIQQRPGSQATSETTSLRECHNRGAVHDLRSALSGSSDSLLREKVPMNFCEANVKDTAEIRLYDFCPVTTMSFSAALHNGAASRNDVGNREAFMSAAARHRRCIAD